MTIIPLHAHQVTPDAANDPDRPPVSSREIVAPQDEARLAARLSAGDPAALDQLVRWLWEPLASYAYRLVGDRDLAMDIAQDACVRVWERRTRKPKHLRAYLFRTTRNRALDRLKTRETRGRLLRLYGASRARPATPDDVFERGRVAEQIDNAIQALPTRRREVFVLAYLKGLSYAEVAEIMEISPKTVQHQMSAALAQLREELTPLIRQRRASPGGGKPGGADAG